jgi:hypothetical protein
MRIGIQVPMLLDNNKVEYQDVGTNIDARSAYLGDGHVLLQMTFERSWIDGNVSVPVAKSDVPQPDSSNGHFQEPVIRAFKSAFELNLREGQPVESTTAADPLTGKVAKVEISFTVVK